MCKLQLIHCRLPLSFSRWSTKLAERMKLRLSVKRRNVAVQWPSCLGTSLALEPNTKRAKLGHCILAAQRANKFPRTNATKWPTPLSCRCAHTKSSISLRFPRKARGKLPEIGSSFHNTLLANTALTTRINSSLGYSFNTWTRSSPLRLSL